MSCMHAFKYTQDTWGKATYIYIQYSHLIGYKVSINTESSRDVIFSFWKRWKIPQISYFYCVLWTYKADELLLHAGLLHIKKLWFETQAFWELKICVQRDITQCTVYWNQALVSNLDIKCFMIKSFFIDGGRGQSWL